jgi:hypothetical protein
LMQRCNFTHWPLIPISQRIFLPLAKGFDAFDRERSRSDQV